ncbi:MAG: hypothetical protein ACLPLP_27640 [Mycobacterium sp.]
MAAKSTEAQALIAALNSELAATAERTGRALVWSAAEADVIAMIGSEVDRRVELAEQHCDPDRRDHAPEVGSEYAEVEHDVLDEGSELLLLPPPWHEASAPHTRR